MSLSILDSASVPRDRPPEWGPHTADLNTTTDLHEENTADLAPAPATEDIEPCAVPSPEKSSLARSIAALSMSLPRIKPATVAPTAPPAAKPALAPGMVLADRYLLERVVGRGGTSIVFRARDMQSSSGPARNAQVAVKTPKPDVADRSLAARRLEHEYKHARQLAHPGVVRALDLYTDPERCFMTMELVEGKLLSQLLREARSVPGPVAQKILRSCADALEHAHGRGVVHGDFKPGNVFVLGDHSVKIVDFGAAIATPEVDPASRVPAATAAYASPEVLAGQTPEPRDDVFSFACVAYELLAGEHPFEGKSSLEARAESRIPPRAWSLTAAQWLALLGALSWEREQRPSDIETLMRALTPQPEAAADPGAAVSFESKRELRRDLMPRERSWGFFVFVACALAVTYIASQRAAESPLPLQVPAAAPTRAIASDPLDVVPAAPAASSLAGSPAPRGSGPSIFEPAPEKAAAPKPAPANVPVKPAAESKPAASAPKAAALSEISFESNSIVTSESSVAAVFLVKRSQPLSGRAKVQWSATSGTADAGIDFASNASGTIEFADGQAQRAIYVPLRNDLLKESDETFTVRLQSPKQARLGSASIATATATIRDDD
jgi:serine/threonine protein kinase